MLPIKFFIPNISIKELVKEARKNKVCVGLHLTTKKKMILANRIELAAQSPVMLTHKTVSSRRKHVKKHRTKRRS